MEFFTVLAVSFLVVSVILFTNATIFCWQSVRFLQQSGRSVPQLDCTDTLIQLRNLGLTNVLSNGLMILFWGLIFIFEIRVDGSASLTQDTFNNNVIFGISEFFRCIATLSHSLFLIARLHQSFHNTAYTVEFKTLILLVLLTVSTSIMFSIMCIITYFINWCPFYTRITVYAIVSVPLWLLFGITQIIIANQFSKKLMQLTISIRQSAITLHNEKFSQSEHVLSDRQEKLLNTIAKQTLLARIESTLLVVAVLVWVLWVALSNSSETVYVSLLGTTIVLFIVYVIAVSVTMWFSFVFAQKQYYFCCSTCHELCLGMYQQRAVEKIQTILIEHSQENNRNDNCDYVKMKEDQTM